MATESTTNSIRETHLQLPYRTQRYQGKVRDVYSVEDEVLVLVASDRISAFDHILHEAIPYKGQVLNETAGHFFDHLPAGVPSSVLGQPDPNVTLAVKCTPFPIEMIVRGHLCGHAWRVYNSGERTICGVAMPEGMKESEPFPEPIITPSTKSQVGHDIDITEREIIETKLMEAQEYAEVRHYALELFKKGQAMAAERGLLLADTKYEFGYRDGKIFLIDEIHTPDSSRYFFAEGFEEKLSKGERPAQLSKEFVREWLMANGFQGLEGQTLPHMPQDFVQTVSDRYIELYERVTGTTFERRAYGADAMATLQANVLAGLKAVGLEPTQG